MPTAEYEIRLKDAFSTPLDKLEAKMDMLERSLAGIQLTLQKGFSGGFNRMASDGERAGKRIASSFGKAKNEISSFGDLIRGSFIGGVIANEATALLGQLRQLPMEAINTAREFRNMGEAIRFASGSDAQKNIDFLENTIDRLGLGIEGTYKGFKTFQGALMGTSLEGDKGREIFTAVSEAATVMKLSAEQSEGAFLALGQMISKGNVSAEELRGQLGERLPGAFQIFARGLGVTTQKLDDMLKKGEVLAVDALPKFAAELKKTFGPGVLSAQNSFNSNWNRFENFLYRSKVTLGESLIPLVNDLISAIPRLDFSPLVTVFKDLSLSISQVYDQFTELFSLFGGSFTTFEKLTFFLRYMSYLFRVPVTAVRTFIEIYSQMINLVRNSIPVFGGLAKVIAGAFKMDFLMVGSGVEQMKEGFKSIAKGAMESASVFLHTEKQGWSKIFAPINDSEKNKAPGWSINGNQQAGGGLSSAGSGAKSKEAGVEKIASGTRNVTVNIQNLIKDVTFQKYDGRNEAQMMDYVRRALLTAVNDVNIVSQ